MTGKKIRKPLFHPKRGQPTLYGPEMPHTAYQLASTGLTEQEIANFFMVAMSTISLWRVDHPDFSEALNNGKAIADARVKKRLYERAIGGFRVMEQKAIWSKGKWHTIEIWREVPPDTTAMIFWLKNRDPENWREKVDHEVRHTFSFVGQIPSDEEWLEHYASVKEPLVIDQRPKEEDNAGSR